jgi:hypothetical protein
MQTVDLVRQDQSFIDAKLSIQKCLARLGIEFSQDLYELPINDLKNLFLNVLKYKNLLNNDLPMGLRVNVLELFFIQWLESIIYKDAMRSERPHDEAIYFDADGRLCADFACSDDFALTHCLETVKEFEKIIAVCVENHAENARYIPALRSLYQLICTRRYESLLQQDVLKVIKFASVKIDDEKKCLICKLKIPNIKLEAKFIEEFKRRFSADWNISLRQVRGTRALIIRSERQQIESEHLEKLQQFFEDHDLQRTKLPAQEWQKLLGQVPTALPSRDLPSGFMTLITCPLSLDVFEEAYYTPQGHTYSGYILEHLMSCNEDPLTRKALKLDSLQEDKLMNAVTAKYHDWAATTKSATALYKDIYEFLQANPHQYSNNLKDLYKYCSQMLVDDVFSKEFEPEKASGDIMESIAHNICKLCGAGEDLPYVVLDNMGLRISFANPENGQKLANALERHELTVERDEQVMQRGSDQRTYRFTVSICDTEEVGKFLCYHCNFKIFDTMRSQILSMLEIINSSDPQKFASSAHAVSKMCDEQQVKKMQQKLGCYQEDSLMFVDVTPPSIVVPSSSSSLPRFFFTPHSISSSSSSSPVRPPMSLMQEHMRFST